MADKPTTDAGSEQIDPHPRIKDPVEHNQRNVLRLVVWGAIGAAGIAIVASFGLHWPTHLAGLTQPNLF